MREPPNAAAVVDTTVMAICTVARNRSGSARSAATVLAPDFPRFDQLREAGAAQRHDRDLGAGKDAVGHDQRQDDEQLGDNHSLSMGVVIVASRTFRRRSASFEEIARRLCKRRRRQYVLVP